MKYLVQSNTLTTHTFCKLSVKKLIVIIAPKPKLCPSHLHVITLIEHALDNNDALLFCSQMNLLKDTCALLDEVVDKTLSFPKIVPSFVNPLLRENYMGKYVMKILLWAIQHCIF